MFVVIHGGVHAQQQHYSVSGLQPALTCVSVFVRMDVISVLNVNMLISCTTLPTKRESYNKMTCVMSHHDNRIGTEPNIPYWSPNN
jgi:hypothetical protein